MTIQYHFVCAGPECRTHVHVTIICHDVQTCDLGQLGEALGFKQRSDQTALLPTIANKWYCQEHVTP